MTFSDSCPKCGFHRHSQAMDCPRCGIIFARWRGSVPAVRPEQAMVRTPESDPFDWIGEAPVMPPPPPKLPGRPLESEIARNITPARPIQQRVRTEEPQAEPQVPPQHPTSDFVMEMTNPLAHPIFRKRARPTWLPSEVSSGDYSKTALLLGLIGIPLYAFPYTHFALQMLMTLVHEMGHAAVGWSLGHVSIPAFDLLNGGGVTSHFPRNNVLVAFLMVVISYPFFKHRKKPAVVRNGVITLVIYLVVVLTPVNEWITIAAGHYTELIWGGLCLYRSLSGRSLRTPMERPIYAVLGGYAMVDNLVFSTKLMFDSEFQNWYASGKEGIGGDFGRLADAFGVTSPLISFVFFIALLTVIPCARRLSDAEVRDGLVAKLGRFLGYD